MNDRLIDTVKYGSLYFPANKHYMGYDSVMCDLCKKKNLHICIGWKRNTDLCLDCAKYIANRLYQEQTIGVTGVRSYTYMIPLHRTESIISRIHRIFDDVDNDADVEDNMDDEDDMGDEDEI